MDEPIKPVGAATDADIVNRVRRGDVQAYGRLVDRYERTVTAAVLPVLKDVHAAQDVVQDVFVQCYVKLVTLREASRFGGWLLTAAEREAVRAAKRSRHVRLRVVDDSNPGLASAATQPTEPVLNDERERLLTSVRRLPEHERVAVSLRYFEGRGVHDIAKALGRPVGTVTKQLSRALQRLRDDLGASDPTAAIREASPCPTHESKTS